jgi:hypothetical protein
MKRQLLQNYILKRKYISNFTKSIRKDILKLTNIASIYAKPQPIAVGWGFFGVDYAVLFFYYVVLAKI